MYGKNEAPSLIIVAVDKQWLLHVCVLCVRARGWLGVRMRARL